MMYVYHGLKTTKGMLNHLTTKKLLSMSINLDGNNYPEFTPNYLVADPRFSKDLSILQFYTFSNQTALNDYLHDNPSGLYQEGNPPFNWTAEKGKPTYRFRKFKVRNVEYCILHIKDAGLVYHLLLGDSYRIPYLLSKTNKLSKEDCFNLSELFNYGLLGRVLKLNLTAENARYEWENIDSMSTIGAIIRNVNSVKGAETYKLGVFNGNLSPFEFKGFNQWNNISIEPDKATVADWESQKSFPKTTYKLKQNSTEVTIVMQPLLAAE